MIDVLIVGFATFAITKIFIDTDGIFDVFKHIRGLLGNGFVEVYDGAGTLVNIVEEIGNNPIAKMVSCFWCLGTWVGLILMVVFTGFNFLNWFAIVGVAGFIYEVTADGKNSQ